MARPAKRPRQMIWKTKLAEPYPHALCEALAEMVLQHPALLLGQDRGGKISAGDSVPKGGSVPETVAAVVGGSDMSASMASSADILCPARSVEKPPEHHYLTHFPKHPGCESCQLSKAMKTRAGKVREKDRAHSGPPVAF